MTDDSDDLAASASPARRFFAAQCAALPAAAETILGSARDRSDLVYAEVGHFPALVPAF
jgi:hypothetical protein